MLFPSSSTGISITLDITSKNRPVPAAHLSFIMKFKSLPLSANFNTLISCPPISITVLALLLSK